MKTGRDLEAILRELQHRRETKLDYLVSTKDVEVQPLSSGVSLIVPTEMDKGLVTNAIALPANSIAHAQMAEEAGIPKPYYDRMLAEEPQLLADNINKWFQKYPSDRMIRTLDGEARAVLSNKYRPLEYEDLAEAAIPVLLDLKEVEIVSMEITERRFYIKAVDKSVVRALADKGAYFGDGKHTFIERAASPAITISDSEVGFGALSVQVGLYDSFCSNLAFFRERSMRKYHAGAKHELVADMATLLTDETRRKTDEATWAQVADVVKGAFNKLKFDSLCDKVEGTIADKIDGDIAKVISLSSKRFGLNETEGKSVLQHLIDGGSRTRFGLYNAITRTAQDVEDYDRATELEQIGADVIDLPRSQWEEVLKQAA